MDLHSLIEESFRELADALSRQDASAWERPSLCAGWRVREVVAHVTMPARMSNEEYFAELGSVGGDFTALSDKIAQRDAELSIETHLTNLRSPVLAAWEPPGGGAIGALNHAVVHGLDVTNALGLPRACSDETARVILDSLVGGVAANFGVSVAGHELRATDLEWTSGSGTPVVGTAAELISLATNRTLPDGRRLVPKD